MMFNWIRSLFSRKRRRQIFQYSDGQRDRYADPIAALMTLERHQTYRRDIHPKMVAEQGDTEATEILCQAVCDAFGVTPFDPDQMTGLTISELMSLHGRFFTYIERLKKNTAISATSQDSSMGSTSSDSNRATTNGTAPSGSTKSESESAKPTLSAKP